jgi:hypothetical protein
MTVNSIQTFGLLRSLLANRSPTRTTPKASQDFRRNSALIPSARNQNEQAKQDPQDFEGRARIRSD